MEEKEQLKHIFEFITSFDNWEETDYLFEKLSAFFVARFQARPMIVFSFPRGEEVGERKLRVVWNKDGITDEEKDELFKLIEAETLAKLIEKHRFSFPHSQGEHHLFYLGDDDTQSYLALLRFEHRQVVHSVLDSCISFVKNSHAQTQRWKNLSRQNSLVHIDDVTGLYNQRKLHKDLLELIRKYERSGENFALLFIDIDHFKSVNDNYGHLIGTKLLSDLGKVLRRVLRDTDLLYRYGGDEFVAIVPDASTNDARKIGDRVLSSVRDELFRIEGNEEIFRISISVGIASFPRDAKDGKEVLELADRMMYRAKNRGRGCVCLAGDFYNKK